MPIANRQIVLASRPVGGATIGDFDQDDFTLVQRDVAPLKEGELLVRNILFSVDPFHRTLMGNTPSEAAVVEIGDVIRGATVGIVEESNNPQFEVGTHVNGWLGWQEYAVSTGMGLRKLDPAIVPLSTALGVLGHTGLTAWIGTSKLVTPGEGGTFVITNAAGSVGSLAIQIAKLRGYRVVGIAGGPGKVAYVDDELGADIALDYQSAAFPQHLAEAMEPGIDRLLDSVGDYMFEALMPFFNKNAQAIIIGQIAAFGDAERRSEDRLPELLNLIQYRDVALKGLQLPDYFHTYPEFVEEMTPLVANGSIKYREQFVEGFEQLPSSLPILFQGGNLGKLIVRA